MVLSLSPTMLATVAGVIFLGGIVLGVTGFGYAITSTAVLATLLEPATAVVLMIIPMLAANASMVRELDASALQSCIARFWPYVGAAVAGTVVGMVFLRQIPTVWLTLALGVLTLVYVAFSQEYVRVPGEAYLEDRCFRPSTGWKFVIGATSGFVFGASNVGVQMVAYLNSLELDRRTFIGVLAMILVGVGGVRVALAIGLGLYGSTDVLAASAVAAIPGLAGVSAGRRVRRYVPVRYQEGAVFVLLVVIGVKLTGDGALAVVG